MKNIFSHIRVAFLSAPLLFFLVAFYAHGADAVPAFTNPLGNVDLKGFLLNIIDVVIIILFPILVLMIVYTGFLYVAARGNPNKIKELHMALFWTVVGGAIVIGAKAIALAIEATVTQIQSGL